MLALPSNSVLDPEYHAKLIGDIRHVAHQAGVPEAMLHRSAAEFCPDAVAEWFADMPKHRGSLQPGLCLVGKFPHTPSLIMQAMAAAYLRNYIDARVYTVTQLFEIREVEGLPDPSVMLISHLFMSLHGKPLTAWQVHTLMDLLSSRFTAGKITVVHVESLPKLAAEYGDAFAQHIKEHYRIVEGA